MKNRIPTEMLIELAECFIFILCLLALIIILVMSASAEAQTRHQIELMIKDAALANNIDPKLAIAIAQVESGLNPKAVGGLGERGTFQLRPEYHKHVEGDTRANIFTAVAYLAEVKRLCEPKYGEAWLIGYNLGPHYQKPIRYPTLFPYFLKVKRAMNDQLALNN